MQRLKALALCCAATTVQLSCSGGGVDAAPAYDVIVVGGGLAGLNSARVLAQKKKSVLVLEANHEVGGRTNTESSVTADGQKYWIDNGGQWIGPTQNHILDLAKMLKVKMFDSFNAGEGTFIYNGTKAKFSLTKEEFPMPKEELLEYEASNDKLDAMAKTVPTDDPSKAKQADEWDSQTVQTWLDQNVKSAAVKFVFRLFVLGYFASEPRDVSLLHFLFYVNAGGGIKSLHTYGIAKRFVGGSQQLSTKMAQMLGKDRVLLNTFVRMINQTDSGVAVVTENSVYFAKQVIVAVSPALSGRITYEPPLPAQRDQFTQRTPSGSSIKVHAVYSSPFWRKQGLNGQTFSDEDAIGLTYDNSPPAKMSKVGIMVGFFEGKEARLWSSKTPEELKKHSIDTFVKFFGPEAAKPIAFYAVDWDSRPFIRGCFSSVLNAGVWTGFPGVIRAPINRIKFAGTETAVKWFAYMNGAIASGERAANEVLADL